MCDFPVECVVAENVLGSETMSTKKDPSEKQPAIEMQHSSDTEPPSKRKIPAKPRTGLLADILQSELALWTFIFTSVFTYIWMGRKRFMLVRAFFTVPIAIFATSCLSWLLILFVTVGRFFFSQNEEMQITNSPTCSNWSLDKVQNGPGTCSGPNPVGSTPYQSATLPAETRRRRRKPRGQRRNSNGDVANHGADTRVTQSVPSVAITQPSVTQGPQLTFFRKSSVNNVENRKLQGTWFHGNNGSSPLLCGKA